VYERHGVIVAKPGQRAALLAVLRDAAASAPAMPGCRRYEVSVVAGDPNAIAVEEEWDSEDAHAASLKLPNSRTLISRARPFIDSMR